MKHTIQLWFHVDSPCLANPQPHPSRPLQKRPGWLLLGPVPPGLAGWSTSKNCQTCINMGFTPKHRGSTSKKSRDNGITTNQSGDLVSFVVIFWDGQWFCQQHGGQAWTGSRPYKPIYFLFWSIRKLFIYPIKVDTGLHGALIDWLIFGTMWCHFFRLNFGEAVWHPKKAYGTSPHPCWAIPAPEQTSIRILVKIMIITIHVLFQVWCTTVVGSTINTPLVVGDLQTPIIIIHSSQIDLTPPSCLTTESSQRRYQHIALYMYIYITTYVHT
jgi:hypothetical protein